MPRRPAEYADAHSGTCDSVSEVSREEGAGEAKERMEQERRPGESEIEGKTPEESDEEPKMTYAEFVRDVQQRSQAMTTQSVEQLCQKMATAFTDQAEKLQKRIDTLMNYTIE